MVKYVQTRLPKAWRKIHKVVGNPIREVLPKDLRRLIKSFVQQPQKLIPELFWDEFERQCEERNLCAGCGEGMDTTGCICWGCNKYDRRNGTAPRRHDWMDSPAQKWVSFVKKKPNLPTQALQEFYWLFRYTRCWTGFLYK